MGVIAWGDLHDRRHRQALLYTMELFQFEQGRGNSHNSGDDNAPIVESAIFTRCTKMTHFCRFEDFWRL
jgi:hypothetical protein